MALRKKTLARRPELLTEATVSIPDGTSITDWLHEVEETCTTKVATILPPAEVNARGGYPDQWVRMVDCKPAEALLCVSRWGGPTDSFQTHFRVPFDAGEDGTITANDPVEVEVEYRAVYTDVTAGDPEAVTEAVDKPTPDQRKKLPEAAYAAPFYEGPDGKYKRGGKFVPAKSLLPFHVNEVSDPTSPDTVDVPRLRNALAKFDGADWSGFGDAADKVKARARKTLDAAAKKVVKSKKQEAAEHGIGDLLSDLRTSGVTEARTALREKKPGAVELAESVFADVSGEHPLAARLGVELAAARA